MPGPRSPASDSTSDESLDAPRDDKVLDRWAQIRKNAAERAQRISQEQQSGRSRSQSAKTDADEGDTSGEETIESRVARIKARVAELTGAPTYPPP